MIVLALWLKLVSVHSFGSPFGKDPSFIALIGATETEFGLNYLDLKSKMKPVL